MGDAFTAVNDDSFTLFYNPASLGRHKHDFTMYPLNGSASASSDVILNKTDLTDFPDDPVAATDILMNNAIHAGANTAPGFKIFNFAMTGIVSDSYDILVRNNANPTVDVDVRQDRGLIMGVGIPIGPNRINKKTSMGSQTSLGFSTKYIERTGVADRIGLLSPTVLNTLGQNKLENFVKGLGRVKGQAWGFDAGFEHIIKRGNSQLVLGLAALDITGTEFKVPKNDNHVTVANIRDQVNAGMAFGQDFGHFHYILSADIRSLNEQMDFGKRLRAGAEIGVPGLSLMGGINSGYYTYGATVDLIFIRVTAGISQAEVGSRYKQQKSSTAIIYLSLFDFSFDA
jgi:hypothetical protein